MIDAPPDATPMEQIHGTCVTINGPGVLMCGPPGSGKSDLALRLIDRGATLVADDRIDLRIEDGAVMMSAPGEISGLLEVRGLGIRKFEAAAQCRLGLAVDLVARDAIERMPEPEFRDYLGISVPLMRIYPFDVSAAAKVRLAASALILGIMPPS